MTRILTNLVGNALKYTKTGIIRVSMKTGEVVQTSEDSHRIPVSLVIEDTGIGISKDYLEHSLYTPFAQEDLHSNGTGLGLSIVKQILGTMGGQMTIQSTVGVGSKVSVDFVADFVMGSQLPDPEAPSNQVLLVKKRFGDMQLSISSPKGGSPEHNAKSLKELRLNVSKTCSEWFGIQYIPGEYIQDRNLTGIRISEVEVSKPSVRDTEQES